jgi:hypothetical protein
MKKGSDWIGLEELQEILVPRHLAEGDFLDSIELLAEESFIEGEMTLDGKMHIFRITSSGFESYAGTYCPEFDVLLEQVLAAVVRQNISDNKSLSNLLQEPQVLIDYALDVLERRRFLTTTKTLGGNISIDNVSVRGRRAAGN